MRLEDRYLLTVIKHRAPKARRTNRRASEAIADDVRQNGGKAAEAKDIGAGIINLYSADSLRSVVTHYHSFNTYHEAVTCEYIGGRGAPKLISIRKQSEHSERFFESYVAWVQARDQWIANYADEVKKARRRLGDYFDERDYPHPEQIAEYWEFSNQYMPIANAEAFELGSFSEEQRNTLEAQLNRAVNKAAREATSEYRKRLQECLGHVANQLRHGKRLHTSLLTNLQNLADADLNAEGREDIAKAVDTIKQTEPAIERALVTRDDSDKDKAAAKIEKVASKLAGLPK